MSKIKTKKQVKDQATSLVSGYHKNIPQPKAPEQKIFKDEKKSKGKTKDKRSKVEDNFENFVTRVGVGPSMGNTLSQGTYIFNLVTRNRVELEAAYRGSWTCGKIIDCKSEDMTRAGIDITTKEAAEKVDEIQTMISRLQINQSLCDGIKWGDLYGGAIGVLQIAGQKYDTPLDPDTVSKSQFMGIAIFDRWQVNPDLINLIDSGPEIGLPAGYNIVTTANVNDPEAPPTSNFYVHHSRCIRFTGIKLPFFQAITEMMWGESVLERPWDRLIAFDNSTMEAANLISRANLRMVGVEGLREILASGGKAQQGLEAMFQMMAVLQSNQGLTLLDKNDEYQTTAYSFAGLSDMMLQFAQQLSGASDIPLVRFFSQSPSGLNATGDSDLRLYYDGINARQETNLRNPWEKILKIMYRSMYGVASPKDFQFSFSPLWQLTLKEKAEVNEINTRSVILAHEDGLVQTQTAMKELRQNSGETGIFSNITDEEIEEAENDPPPMPVEVPTEANGEPKPLKPPKASGTGDSAFKRIKQWLKL